MLNENSNLAVSFVVRTPLIHCSELDDTVRSAAPVIVSLGMNVFITIETRLMLVTSVDCLIHVWCRPIHPSGECEGRPVSAVPSTRVA